ncbi:flagellar assembly protein A [Massilia sp. BSC265]|uniref:flagellar assembly protein A n=1 Tax=Massilia sp. BSC265 TaxID=1549812 RepID=UPI0009DF0D51|nr:flagellar assembly protein A [Massilia sp. BSC265]
MSNPVASSVQSLPVARPVAASAASGTPAATAGAGACIARHADGVYCDVAALGHTLLAAVEGILLRNQYFAGLDYPVLIKALFGHGPELPRNARGETVVRLADGILPFDPARRQLYRAVKIADGQAEYYFEPVFLADAEGVEQPTSLDIDEFIADMWMKGIRFGIDVEGVAAAIASGAAGRIVVARRLPPRPGQDARVVEVSNELHRSDAPRQLANGRLDLMSFQNRFPQVQRGTRLLRKLPRVQGEPGFDLSGIALAPEMPLDLELMDWSGPGTTVDRIAEGEFVVALQDGFLNVEGNRISVGDKIVSHDGVSARTTGNLQLEGDYEEFGEVQENRVVEGGSITVHADVFGHIVSRGGVVCLNRNLMGGSARNADGPIVVQGVASSAVIGSANGEVSLQRAENCVISGSRVSVVEAVNCEIVADVVEITQAEGCAIAAKRIAIERAAPRGHSEMRIFVLRPDCARIDAAIGMIRERVGRFGELAGQRRAAMGALAAQPEVASYLRLAGRVRKGELVLTPEQQPAFKKLAAAAAPALKQMAALSQETKDIEAEQQSGMALLARLEAQRAQHSSAASVAILQAAGDITVRALDVEPDSAEAERGSHYHLAPREIKARLRDASGAELLFAGSSGSFSWSTAELATS